MGLQIDKKSARADKRRDYEALLSYFLGVAQIYGIRVAWGCRNKKIFACRRQERGSMGSVFPGVVNLRNTSGAAEIGVRRNPKKNLARRQQMGLIMEHFLGVENLQNTCGVAEKRL